MATVTSLSHHSTSPNGGTPRVVPLPSLGAQIDHLHELRGLIRQAQDEERRLTQQIVSVMESSGLADQWQRAAGGLRHDRDATHTPTRKRGQRRPRLAAVPPTSAPDRSA